MPNEFVQPLPRPVPRLVREIDGLRVSDWPGRRGPLVCLADPLGTLPDLAPALGLELAPEWRIFALASPPELPYQAQASQVLRVLDTFGFEGPVLLGSGLAAGVALLIAAWYPNRIAALVLVNPGLTPARRLKIAALAGEQAAWLAWLDAPPAWARLERQVTCPKLRLRAATPRRVVEKIRPFLQVPPY